MIKLIVFDLDGVLLDSRELHFKALNQALEAVHPKYIIQRDEHLAKYDGRPTSVKLDLLTQEKGLPRELHKDVWTLKQAATIELMMTEMNLDPAKGSMIRALVEAGYEVSIASNSVRKTLEIAAHAMGVDDRVSLFSNEDTKLPKPHPEMYLRAMIHHGARPAETLVVEDSHIGRKAAMDSGASVFEVTKPEDVTLNTVLQAIGRAESTSQRLDAKPKWISKDLRILIPMAGSGSRFATAGYTFPKPLIDVNGRPMIQVILENLNIQAEYIFIVQDTHYDRYNLQHLLNLLAPGCTVIKTQGLTEGAACTALLAKEFINDDRPLLIANSDQFVDWEPNDFMYAMKYADGGILTFTGTHPKWSFVRTNEDGFVCEVAEKRPISDQANVGIYYYARGADFVSAVESMIQKDIRVNGEFYIAPAYNELIAAGKKIRPFRAKQMWGLGTPEDLDYFLRSR